MPAGTQSITIGSDGQVSVRVTGQTASQTVGQLTVTDFANPVGLQPIGENLYLATSKAVAIPFRGLPVRMAWARSSKGMLEASNVNATEELVNLIQAQRVYEMNSKVISSVIKCCQNVTQQL